jgi:hypothetical protein
VRRKAGVNDDPADGRRLELWSIGLMVRSGHDDDIDNLEQPFARKRFLDEHVAADFERPAHVIGPVLTGQKDNGHVTQVGLCLDLLTDIVTVDTGHHNVQKDNVGSELAGLDNRGRGRVFDANCVPGFGKESLNYLSDFGFIVNDQNAGTLDVNFV